MSTCRQRRYPTCIFVVSAAQSIPDTADTADDEKDTASLVADTSDEPGRSAYDRLSSLSWGSLGWSRTIG